MHSHLISFIKNTFIYGEHINRDPFHLVAKYWVHVYVEKLLFFTDFHVFSNYSSFPTGRRLLDTKVGFAQKASLPNVVGAVDGTFIPIMAPMTNPDIYVCRKGFHTINVQAVVDHKLQQQFFNGRTFQRKIYLWIPSSFWVIQNMEVIYKSLLWCEVYSLNTDSPTLLPSGLVRHTMRQCLTTVG